jgi:alkylated DNA repair protein (DNA oxidative demethylase)
MFMELPFAARSGRARRNYDSEIGWGAIGRDPIFVLTMTLSLFQDEAEPKLPRGVSLFRGALSAGEQIALLDDVANVIAQAPLYRPRMRNGTPLINQMTNCGPWGWMSDEKGYRYQGVHPVTGAAWPPIPARLLTVSHRLMSEVGIAGYEPDACLVNAYGESGRLNLHQDYDEADFGWPIISVSLGADAVFVVGGYKRKDPVEPVLLHSGDIVVLHNEGRTLFHGVKKVLPSTSPIAHPLFADLARINLTLRRAK